MAKNIDKSYFTYRSFIDVDKIPRVTDKTGSIQKSSEEGSENFTGTPNYEEAKKLALYGWDTGIKELKEFLDKLDVQGTLDMKHNIVGSVVDVPAFLSGSPECMLEFIDYTEREKPRAVIYVPLGYNSDIEVSEALQYSKSVLSILAELNPKYELKIIGFYGTRYSGVDQYTFVSLKEFEEPFILNNFAFAVHPSYFRRIKFRYMETKKYNDWGYGSSFKTISKEQQKVLLQQCEEDAYRVDKVFLHPNLYDSRKGVTVDKLISLKEVELKEEEEDLLPF